MATTVEYNGEVVATIPNGNKATIPIANKKMKTDIVITVPKAEGGTDSPLPTEVSTEAEMTALLESGEVGGVYKYTGTTGTYENGALYVLEEETAVLGDITITVPSSNEDQLTFNLYTADYAEKISSVTVAKSTAKTVTFSNIPEGAFVSIDGANVLYIENCVNCAKSGKRIYNIGEGASATVYSLMIEL